MPDSACTPAVLVNLHCELGENPLWDDRRQLFYWTNITGGAVWRHDPQSGETTRIYTGPNVGGFTFETDGALLLFRINDVARLETDGAVRVIRPFAEAGCTRFNDVIADPRGRVFAGAVGETKTSGGVFRYDPDGSMRQVISGTGVPNGMAFTADRKRFFWTCSTRRQIWLYDYDEETGDIANGRVWYQADGDEGLPDGLTIDTDDNIWSARWDGFRLRQHAADDGRVLRDFEFPVAKVSSVCFGGAELDTMFLTTAGGDEKESLDGAVFTLRVPGVRGCPEFRSQLG